MKRIGIIFNNNVTKILIVITMIIIIFTGTDADDEYMISDANLLVNKVR